MSIAIFPAAGALGSSTYTPLLTLLKPSDVVLIARNPSKLEQEKKDGANVRKADYDDEQSLEHVFEGVKALNLISYVTFEHEHRVEVHKAAIDAARASGVKHIFYSSLAFAGPTLTPSFAAHVMLPHLDTEAYLVELAREDPSFSYTIVRIGVYSESYPIYTASFDINAPPSPSDGNNHGNDDGRDTIRIPHDGAGPGISWAKRSELGEAVAKLMVQYVEHPNPETFEWRNKMMVLGGPKEYSLKETVDVLSDVVGRELRITEIPVDEYVNLPAVKASLTDKLADWSLLWSTSFEAIKHGEAAVVTTHLQELIGREPEGFRETVRALKNRSEPHCIL